MVTFNFCGNQHLSGRALSTLLLLLLFVTVLSSRH